MDLDFLEMFLFGKRMFIFWGIKKLKKIDRRDISLIFVFMGTFSIWGVYLDFGGYFWISYLLEIFFLMFFFGMITLWLVRKLKKIDQRDISHLFVFLGVFWIFWKGFWNQTGHILGGQKAGEN